MFKIRPFLVLAAFVLILLAGGPSHRTNLVQTLQIITSTFNTSHGHTVATPAFLDIESRHCLLLVQYSRHAEPSHLYVSDDFGQTYRNKTDELRFMTDGTENEFDLPEEKYALVTTVHTNDQDDSMVVLADSSNKLLFISNDYGENFVAKKLFFVPDSITFHKHHSNYLVAFDSAAEKIYYSDNDGDYWYLVQSFVKSYFLVDDVDKSTLYFSRESFDGHLTIAYDQFESGSYFQPFAEHDLYHNVTEWQVKDNVIYATQVQPDGTYEFFINPGLKKTSSVRAVFFDNDSSNFTASPKRHFYLIDAVKDEYILVAMRRTDANTCNLYRAPHDFLDYSYNSQLQFELVLEHVFCHYPMYTWTDNFYLKYYAGESFVDVHKIEGMGGAYIASTLRKENATRTDTDPEALVSLITWDFGGHWFLLTAPQKTAAGVEFNCFIQNDCSLHLSMKYAAFHSASSEVLTSESAPGLIMATGSVGTSLNMREQKVFVSRNGGVTWQHLFDGDYFYNFGDSGGILVAIKKFYHVKPDTVLMYSTDFGHNWLNETLPDTRGDLQIYEILNNDHKKSIYFSVYTARMGEDGWVIFNVNGTQAFVNETTGLIRHCVMPEQSSQEFEYSSSVENVTYSDFSLWTVPAKHPELESDFVQHESHVFPYTNGSDIVGCVLGMRHIYARRNADSRCVVNDVSKTLSKIATFFENTHLRAECECTMEDIECDVGYRGNRTLNKCVPIDANAETVEMNKECKPYVFESETYHQDYYYKTTGMRLKPNDMCFGSWSFYDLIYPTYTECPDEDYKNQLTDNRFLYVSKGNEILRIDFADRDMPPLVSKFPVPVQKVVALDYDVYSECLYYVDVEADVLAAFCFGRTDVLLHTGLWAVESIVYDWVSDSIYFSNAREQYIDIVTARNYYGKPAHQTRRRILDAANLVKPRNLAIDPNAAFLFWTDWTKDDAYIGRSNLDGSEVRKLAVSPDVYWPNGIAVDFDLKRIVWVDAKLEQIVSCDYECSATSKKVIGNVFNDFRKPFGIAVMKDAIFFEDWEKQEIVRFKKDDSFTVTDSKVLMGNVSGVLEIKGFYDDLTKISNNFTCVYAQCSGICVNMADEKTKCLCPDGFSEWEGKCVCPDYRTIPFENGTCPMASCENAADVFKCEVDNVCVPMRWRCNGYDDCSDGSDELFCPELEEDRIYQCNYNGKLIVGNYRCENVTDCPGAAEELFCDSRAKVECTTEQFRCVMQDWTEYDQCIDAAKVCDGIDDCIDGSDELDCEYNTNIESCESRGLISCYDPENNCYSWNERCDGHSQCSNDDDEIGCDEPKCDLSDHFQCDDGLSCVPNEFKCDGIVDCFDETDEVGCEFDKDVTTKKNADDPFSNPVQEQKCVYPMGLCANNQCIPFEWFCDGIADCDDLSDEASCPEPEAKPEEPEPSSTTAAPIETTTISKDCYYGSFKCYDENKCISYHFRCDNEINCDDGSDEMNCDAYEFAADDIIMFTFAANESSITLSWLPLFEPLNDTISILPIIMRISNVFGAEPWTNQSDWIRNEPDRTTFTFTHLHPDTSYNISMRFLLHKANRVFQTRLNISTWTTGSSKYGEDGAFVTGNIVADDTMNLQVEYHNKHVVAMWSPPVSELHKIIGYELIYQSYDADDTFVQRLRISDPTQTKLEVPFLFFRKGYHTYAFALLAKITGSKDVFESNIVTESISNYPSEQGLNITLVQRLDHQITLVWSFDNDFEEMANATLSVVDVSNDLILKFVRTDEPISNHEIVVDRLSPGTEYAIYIKILDAQNEVITYNHIKVETTGIPLPDIENATATVDESVRQVRFQWTKPDSLPGQSSDKWIYGVYMALNVKDLYVNGPRVNTTSLEATVDAVSWCRNYFWSITIIGPNGIGPMMKPLQLLELKFNILDAPKSIYASGYESFANKMAVSWIPSCSRDSEDLKYIINVHNTNTTERYSLVAQSKNNTIVLEVCFGIAYEIKMRTFANVKGLDSEFSPEIVYTTQRMDAPTDLAFEMLGENTVVLSWSHRPIAEHHVSPDFRYDYVVHVLRANRSPIEFQTQSNKIEIAIDQLQSIDLDAIVFQIALRSEHGCLSDWAIFSKHGMDHIIHRNGAYAIEDSTSWWRSFGLVVLICLIAAVIFAVAIIGRMQRIRTWWRPRETNSRWNSMPGSLNSIRIDFLEPETSTGTKKPDLELSQNPFEMIAGLGRETEPESQQSQQPLDEPEINVPDRKTLIF